MLRSGFILLLLAAQAIWLNVVIPGHTRGRILLGAAPPGDASGASAAPLPSCHARPTGDDDRKPAKPAKRPGTCAVCAYAATMAAPDAPVSLDDHRPLIVAAVATPRSVDLAPRPMLVPPSHGPPCSA